MIKNTVIALTTIAALAGVAAPAIASGGSFDEDYVLAALHEKGISADAVEEWGSSYYVAFVTDETGAQKIVYLDPDSLEVVR